MTARPPEHNLIGHTPGVAHVMHKVAGNSKVTPLTADKLPLSFVS